MADRGKENPAGAVVSTVGREPELTDNKFADIDYSDAWDGVGTEWTELAKTQQAARLRRTFEAADAEFDRWRYFWEHYRMMAALDRTLPKRSYESMVGK